MKCGFDFEFVQYGDLCLCVEYSFRCFDFAVILVEDGFTELCVRRFPEVSGVDIVDAILMAEI